MIARRIIHDQAKPLEAIGRDVIIPIRIFIIHKEVLIDVEILSNDVPGSLLLSLTVIQADDITLRILIGAKVFVTVTATRVFVFNQFRLIFIGVPHIFS